MTIENSFQGSNLSGIANKGVLALAVETLKFRAQLTLRNELREQSGWNDELNEFLQQGVQALDATLKGVTYKSSTSPTGTVMPSPMPRTLQYELSGSDPDFPQMDDTKHKNDWLKIFIWELDHTFCEVTRLDCRHSGYAIPEQQAAMIGAMLNNLMTIIQEKGGETNRVFTPTGTLPSQESQTFHGQSN